MKSAAAGGSCLFENSSGLWGAYVIGILILSTRSQSEQWRHYAVVSVQRTAMASTGKVFWLVARAGAGWCAGEKGYREGDVARIYGAFPAHHPRCRGYLLHHIFGSLARCRSKVSSV